MYYATPLQSTQVNRSDLVSQRLQFLVTHVYERAPRTIFMTLFVWESSNVFVFFQDTFIRIIFKETENDGFQVLEQGRRIVFKCQRLQAFYMLPIFQIHVENKYQHISLQNYLRVGAERIPIRQSLTKTYNRNFNSNT